ncbi:MAG: hypothetical protein U0X76_02835 [Bacteroidia bacterium]
MLDQLLPYLAGICLVVLLIVRFLRSRRRGAAAVKFDVIYLAVYAFLAGILISFFLNHPEFGMMGLLIFATFMAGFIFRAIPLFRLISDVEKKAEGRF